MDFADAFRELRRGRTIKRPQWDYVLVIQVLPGRSQSMSPDIYVPSEFIMAVYSDGTTHRWDIFDVDLLASDWVALPLVSKIPTNVE